MGAYWLHDLPRALVENGIDVELYPGWETRSRSSGGLDQIYAVFVHHTAGGPNQNTDNAAYAHYISHPDRPVGNITLGREGRVILGAAGAANCQGRGGPVYTTSKGTIPLDKGNTYGIAIEACNNGVGELWTQVQLEMYVKLCAVICDTYGLDPLRDVIAHYEWAPTRKIDPAGGFNQFPYAKTADRYLRWDMDRFRQEVNSTTLGDDMKTLDKPRRAYDSRQSDGMMPARQWREHTVGNCNEAVVQLTYISDGTAGHAYVSPAGVAGTTACVGGDSEDRLEYGPAIPVKTPGGRIRVTAGPGNFHYVIDVYATDTGQ